MQSSGACSVGSWRLLLGPGSAEVFPGRCVTRCRCSQEDFLSGPAKLIRLVGARWRLQDEDTVKIQRKNEGYVLVTVALSLVVLLGFGGFAVDLGMLYSARGAAQRAADAAALAGALSFVVTPLDPQPQTAIDRAVRVATNNTIYDSAIQPGDLTVPVDIPNRRVTVQLTYSQPTYLARVLGINTLDISVRADAEASPVGTGSTCAKPFFIPNTVLAGTDPCNACGIGTELLIAGGAATPFALTQIGQQFNIRPTQPQNALAPGQFYSIDIGGAGAANYRDNIGYCAPLSVYCQQSYEVESGNMVGPTKQGVLDLIGPNPDLYISPGRYSSNGYITDTSRSLIVAPVWDVCAAPDYQCPGNDFPPGGNTMISMSGFAILFIEGVQGSDVVARLIGVTGCVSGAGGGGGGSGSGPAPPETGPFGVPVRLVRPPVQAP